MNGLFLIVAFVCFLLAAVGVSSQVNLIALGLCFWTLSLLVLVPIGTFAVNQAILFALLIIALILALLFGFARIYNKP